MNTRNLFKSGFLRAALMLLLAVMTFPTGAWADDYYYVAEFDNGTLTFKKTTTAPNNSTSWDATNTGNSDSGNPGWYTQYYDQITTVVFDASFVDARPKSCRNWFVDFQNLTTIIGLNYLNTSEVTDMHGMFGICLSLTSLDLSSFNTSQVTDMSNMFQGCSRLTSLDLSSFNTSEVTDMENMFKDCEMLTSLTIGSGFTVGGGTYTTNMFGECNALANGTLIVKGTSAPSIAKDIFNGVFTGGTLVTNLTKTQLGISETSSPYHWKGGTFVAYNNLIATVTTTAGTDLFCVDATNTTDAAALQAAVTAVNAATSDVTLKLYEDVDLGRHGRIIFNNTSTVGDGEGARPVAITLDLNGKTLSNVHGNVGLGFVDVKENTALTISNSGSGGGITASMGYCIYNNGTLTLNGAATITSPYDCIYINRGMLTLNGQTTFSCGNSRVDINLKTGQKIGFGTDFVANSSKIKVSIDYYNELPYTFTSGYGANVKSGGTVIDPADIFTCSHSRSIAGPQVRLVGEGDAAEVQAYLPLFSVAYIDANGKLHDNADGQAGTDDDMAQAYKLTGTEMGLGKDGEETWYVTDFGTASSMTYFDEFYIHGTVHIILADGKHMKIGNSVNNPTTGMGLKIVTNQASLNFYSQSDDNNTCGKLSIYCKDHAIHACDVTVNGGIIEVYSTTSDGIDATRAVTINGGQVTANGGTNGKGISAGSEIILGWRNADDFITVNSYNGTVKTAEGKRFVVYDGETACGIISGIVNDLSTINGKKLTPGPIAYAVLSEDGKTLTFKYGVHTVSGDNEWDVSNTGTSNPGWIPEDIGIYPEITQVVFEESFADARPKSCNHWFYKCRILTTITDLEYLNTSEVTDMTSMFFGCSGLTSLDVSHFDTSKVTGMGSMFQVCSSLTSLDLSSFDTSEVTNMMFMFSGCRGLTSLDVSHFNTSKVTDMSFMFEGCNSLTSLDLSNFDTSEVTDMRYMFSQSSSLKSLTIGSGFTNGKEKYNNYQTFYGCTNLAEGMLIVNGTGSVENNDLKPSIAKDIFKDVFTNGTLATNLTATQLGASGPANGLYIWRGGKFKSVGKVKIPYIDDKGKLHNDDGTQTPDDTSDDCAEALPITSANSDVEYGTGWYFVTGNVTINGKLQFTDDAHLILCDGAMLTVNYTRDETINSGIDFPICSNSNFSIYGQSTGDSMGKLTATSVLHGIRAGKVTVNDNDTYDINGGNVTISGGIITLSDITADNVTISGGTVNANSRGAYAIRTNNGNVTISGGTFKATGRVTSNGIATSAYTISVNDGGVTISGGQVTLNSLIVGIVTNGKNGDITISGGTVNINVSSSASTSGILAYDGHVTISGGQVSINPTNSYGIGTLHANRDITLGWTNADDFILASSYKAGGKVKIAEGKIFKYTEGSGGTTTENKLYEGDIEALVEGGGLNNVTLTPYGIGGYCGKDDATTTDTDESRNLTWEIPLVDHDNNAETPKQLSTALSVVGTGAMADYTNADTPWKDHNDNVNLIIVPTEAAYTTYAPMLNTTDKAKLAPSEITLAKNTGGWNTYCHNYPVSYSLSDGHNTGDASPKAYTVSGLSDDGTSVQTTAVTDNLVAPATPLLLGYTVPDDNNTTPDENVILTAEPSTVGTATTSTNDIVSTQGTGITFWGALADKTFSTNEMSGKQYYVLSGGKMFVRVDGAGTINAHRCWIELDNANAARSLGITSSGTTGINDYELRELNELGLGVWYSLDGRKLDKQPKRKGIYIKDGRKVVIK